jgi:hypothetical protein
MRTTPLRRCHAMVKHDTPEALHIHEIEPPRAPRVVDPFPSATHLHNALLPTWTHPTAGRVRDVGPLIAALRNPTACGLVADLLEHRAVQA